MTDELIIFTKERCPKSIRNNESENVGIIITNSHMYVLFGF